MTSLQFQKLRDLAAECIAQRNSNIRSGWVHVGRDIAAIGDRLTAILDDDGEGGYLVPKELVEFVFQGDAIQHTFDMTPTPPPVRDTWSRLERRWASKHLRSGYCCGPAAESNCLRHASNCRVWGEQHVAARSSFDEEDIGQGEGCEGGKCSRR